MGMYRHLSAIKELSMQLTSKFAVSGVGFFFCGIATKIIFHAKRLAYSAPHTLVGTNTFKPTFIVFLRASIAQIFSISSESKITKSIIGCVTVNMVDMMQWKFTEHIKPRQAMCPISNIINRYQTVTIISKTAGLFASFNSIRSLFYANKYSGFWIILQHRFEKFLSQHLSIHFKYHPDESVAGNRMSYFSIAKSSHNRSIA
jgi:hypothetical protein